MSHPGRCWHHPVGGQGLRVFLPRGRKSGGKCSLQLRWPQDTLGGSWEMHSVQAGSARQAVLGPLEAPWAPGLEQKQESEK